VTYKLIQVGTGGHGASWCRHFLPPNVADGLVEVVAAVDTNPDALQNAREGLGLRADQCYTDIARAFDENRADFCTIVVPPTAHEAVVDLALAHDLHILSEKPIADTLAASVRIAKKVRQAGKKMAVTMSHRFDQDKATLRQELRSGRSGPLDYLACRFTAEVRRFGGYTHGVYREDDPLMVQMAVHHLDILADLAGAPCETIYAQTWNPAWSEFRGDVQGMALLRFANGVRASYEAANANAVGLNGWGQEYIRAECERATLILDHRRLEKFPYDSTVRGAARREGEGEAVPLLTQPKWANAWLIEQFVRWLDGGPPMETEVEANLQSVALFAAGIQSSRTGQPVAVQEMLNNSLSETSP